MKQIGSVTITSPGEISCEIGTRLGAHGLPTHGSSVAADWLARQEPADVDRAAQSRASRHGAALQVRYEGRYPQNGPSYMVAVGCDVDGTAVACQSALSEMLNFATPAAQADIEGWLAELSVIVARRKDDEFGDALRLEAYASRLRAYPSDVVRKALLGTSWQFWPTWAELERICEAMAGPRRMMIAALRHGPQEPPQRDIEAAERHRAARIAAEFLAECKGQDARARAQERIPHWSEGAAPDDPRFAELRRARIRAGIILSAPEPF